MLDWSCHVDFNYNLKDYGAVWGQAELALDTPGDEFYVKNILVYSESWDDKNLWLNPDHWLFHELQSQICTDERIVETFWSEYRGRFE